MPEPLAHQREVLEDPARFKVLRWGRRGAKTRGELIAAILGHGPLEGGAPHWKGVAQGADVAWLTPDYPQSRAIWREEIRPRFKGQPGVEMNETERTMSLAGGGMLELRSAESVHTLRGRKLGGLIVDEAAWMDLEAAWKDVLLPCLLDLNGWAILGSTPNAGHDGNQAHLTPSFFNRLCARVMAGEMGPQWRHWHRTTRDNPRLSPAAVEAIYAEYPEGSAQQAQELDAALIVGGVGVAFPEWRPAWHTTGQEPPSDWRVVAGMDWGYANPGCGLIACCGPDREVWIRHEYYFKKQTPFDVGFTWGTQMKRYATLPEWIALDSACWGATDGGPLIYEEIQRGLTEALKDRAPMVTAVSKRGRDGKNSRSASKLLVHEGLKPVESKVGADGLLPAWAMPRLRVHTDCAHLIRTLPGLPVSENDPEDVDTEAEDHAYDALRYLLMSRTPVSEGVRESTPKDRHPGLDRYGRRRRRDGLEETEMVEGYYTGVQWTNSIEAA